VVARTPKSATPTSGKISSLAAHLWLIPLFIAFIGILTSWSFQLQKNSSTPYHLLQADAFLNRRIDIEPGHFRYDLAYRDGKWFTYWGYVPAAVLVPFRWAFGSRLTDRSVAIAVGLLTMVVWYLVARHLPSLGLPRLEQWEVLLLTFYSSFGQLTFHLSKTPIASYMNHLFSFFFLSLSILFLLRPTRARAIISITMFCLACLTRISLFIVAPLFLILTLAVTDRDWRGWPNRGTVQLGIAMGVIVVLSICLHLYLNYIRFGDIFEFGTAVVPESMRGHPTYSFQYIWTNLWIYLASPVRYSLTPPFVRGARVGNAIWSYQFGVLIPLLVLASKAGVIRARPVVVADGAQWRIGRLLLGLATIWVAYFVFLLFFRFTGEITFGGRYLLDTQPFLLLIILISYTVIRNQPAMRLFSVACLLLSGAVQILSPPMLR